MKSKHLRIIIPLAVMVLIAGGFVLNASFGTLSAFGWKDVSLLCPLGSLTTMLSERTLIPRALISLVIVVVLVILLGRAFCGWVCPVPVISKLRGFFGKKTSNTDLVGCGVVKDKASEAVLSRQNHCAGCAGCEEARTTFDSRHVILGGSLLTAAVFGFPVFCLICPVGLTFASILLIIRLFAFGDITWSVLVVPLLLVVEVVFFRKWCSKICPISALLSLIAKANRTFRPSVNQNTCIESSHNGRCEECAAACPEGINPRNPEAGASWSECTKCRACVEACPTQSLTMPFLPPKADKDTAPIAAEK